MKSRVSPLATMPASVEALRQLEQLERTLAARQEQKVAQAKAQQEPIRWVFVDPG